MGGVDFSGKAVDQLLDESTGRVVEDVTGELEVDLELHSDGYSGLENYAEETLEDYDEIEDPRDIVALSKDLKNNVTDLVAYGELYSQKLDFLDEFQDEYLEEDDFDYAANYLNENPHIEDTRLDSEDLATIHALREGRLYDEMMRMGDERDWDESTIQDSPLFSSVNDVADGIIADYYFRGGKGLRSTVGMVTQYGFEDKVDYKTMMMGSLVETFHSSTLVQDDLMDGDTERRGRSSANIITEHVYGEKGKDIPITTGNVMEAWANDLNIHRQLDIPQESKEAIVQAQDIVNRGQNEDILMGDDLSKVTLDDYKHMSMGKTGFLYGAMMKMVAEHSMEHLGYERDEKEEVNELIGEYTANFNFAFQSSDDLLEVVGGDLDKSDSDIPNRKTTATVLTTDRYLGIEGDEGEQEFFRSLFATDSGDFPGENLAAAEGMEDPGKVFDKRISRIMESLEPVHRAQLQRWAEEASGAAKALEDVVQDERSFSAGASNILSKAAEVMNERTY